MIVDAIRTLFEVAGAACVGQVDWQHWQDSARTLPKDHPTAARSLDVLPTGSGGCDDARKDAAGLGSADVAAYLDYLALRRKVSSSTQSIALNALVLLFRDVLGQEALDFGEFARAKRPHRLPSVPEVSEVSALMKCLDGFQRLMAELMYSTGLRLMECCRLRVQDIDFAYKQLMVRNAKVSLSSAQTIPLLCPFVPSADAASPEPAIGKISTHRSRYTSGNRR